MRPNWRILYFLGVGILLAIIFKLNPYLFKTRPLYVENVHEKLWKGPVVSWRMIQAQSSSKAIFYRQDLERTARFQGTISKKPTLEWQSEKINVGIHNASKASPVADESGVYIGGDNSWFYAFDHAGTLKWKIYLADAGPGIHSTAVLDQDYVYFGTYSGWLYAVHKETGLIHWQRKYGETVGSSPLIYENSLIVAIETFSGGANGYVVRIDKKSGELLWQTDFLGEQSHSSPALDLKTGYLFVGANNSKFFAFDVTSGKLIWEVLLKGPIKGTPLVVEDKVFVSDWGKNFWCLGTQKGDVIWRTPLDVKSQVSPVYLADQEVLIIADRSSNLYSIRKDGTLLRKKNLGIDRYLTSPVVVNDTQILYLCEKDLLCLSSSAGKIFWGVPLNGKLTSVPFVYQNKIYVSLDEGSLVSFRSL
jgi:outer membrane protein assembly factor BamB